LQSTNNFILHLIQHCFYFILSEESQVPISYPPKLGDRKAASATVNPSVETSNSFSDVLGNGGNHSMAQYGMTMMCSGDLPRTTVNYHGAHHGNPDVFVSANFSLAEYQKTRQTEKYERMERQHNDHVSHSDGHRDECEAFDVDVGIGIGVNYSEPFLC
jgi:hypothetical protein